MSIETTIKAEPHICDFFKDLPELQRSVLQQLILTVPLAKRDGDGMVFSPASKQSGSEISLKKPSQPFIVTGLLLSARVASTIYRKIQSNPHLALV